MAWKSIQWHLYPNSPSIGGEAWVLRVCPRLPWFGNYLVPTPSSYPWFGTPKCCANHWTTELKNDCASHWSAARNAGSRARSFKKTICSPENDSLWLNQKNKVAVWKIRILLQFLTSFDVSPKIEGVYKLCKNCFRAVNAPFAWLYGEWR